MQLLQPLKDRWSAYASLSPWRRWLLVGILVAAGVYLAWCKFGSKPIKPGATVAGKTAHEVADMPRKEVTPKRLMVLTPKAEVIDRLDLAPEEAANDDEEIIEAVDVPATKYGSTSTTFVNLSSGQARTIIRANESPWFSFRRDNAIGIGYGAGTHGQTGAIRYRRDILQVKEVYLSGELEGNYAATRASPLEAKGMIWIEFRK